MMLTDLHNHLGYWSPDASQSYEDLMEAALHRGLHGVGISDHYDYDCSTSDGAPWIFIPSWYMDAFYERRRLPSKRKADDPPGFLVGVEIGYIPAAVEHLHELLADYPFDYAVLSLHYLNGYDPYSHGDHVYADDLETVYTRVIDTIAKSAEAIPEAKIIGHYDFFSRYAPNKESKMFYRHAPSSFEQLFKTMRRNEQVLEINMGTIGHLHKRKGYELEEAMPDPEILMCYRDYCSSLLTIASDAHHADQNGRYVKETLDYLKRLGFERFVWFEANEMYGD